jgi:hypothetical protein
MSSRLKTKNPQEGSQKSVIDGAYSQKTTEISLTQTTGHPGKDVSLKSYFKAVKHETKRVRPKKRGSYMAKRKSSKAQTRRAADLGIQISRIKKKRSGPTRVTKDEKIASRSGYGLSLRNGSLHQNYATRKRTAKKKKREKNKTYFLGSNAQNGPYPGEARAQMTDRLAKKSTNALHAKVQARRSKNSKRRLEAKKSDLKHIERFSGPLHMKSVFQLSVKKLVRALKAVLSGEKIEILNELAYSYSFCCSKGGVEFNIEIKKVLGSDKLLGLTFQKLEGKPAAYLGIRNTIS